MSATNRGAVRHAHDFYRTPSWATEAIAYALPSAGTVLDAGAGDGAISRALIACGIARERMIAVEPEPVLAESCRSAGVTVEQVDFLSRDWDTPTIVMNPPYVSALEFVEHALRQVARHEGTVLALLRINFLEGQRRASFHKAHPCDVLVLPKRPSFTGSGTDATGYAWMVWGRGRGGRWRILDIDGVRRRVRSSDDASSSRGGP